MRIDRQFCVTLHIFCHNRNIELNGVVAVKPLPNCYGWNSETMSKFHFQCTRWFILEDHMKLIWFTKMNEKRHLHTNRVHNWNQRLLITQKNVKSCVPFWQLLIFITHFSNKTNYIWMKNTKEVEAKVKTMARTWWSMINEPEKMWWQNQF